MIESEQITNNLHRLANVSGFTSVTSGVSTSAGTILGVLNEYAAAGGLIIAIVTFIATVYFKHQEARRLKQHREKIIEIESAKAKNTTYSGRS